MEICLFISYLHEICMRRINGCLFAYLSYIICFCVTYSRSQAHTHLRSYLAVMARFLSCEQEKKKKKAKRAWRQEGKKQWTFILNEFSLKALRFVEKKYDNRRWKKMSSIGYQIHTNAPIFVSHKFMVRIIARCADCEWT